MLSNFSFDVDAVENIAVLVWVRHDIAYLAAWHRHVYMYAIVNKIKYVKSHIE